MRRWLDTPRCRFMSRGYWVVAVLEKEEVWWVTVSRDGRRKDCGIWCVLANWKGPFREGRNEVDFAI